MTDVEVHESVPLEVTLMFGAVVLLVMVILVVPVQAFAPVPVTVYTPALVATKLAPVTVVPNQV